MSALSLLSNGGARATCATNNRLHPTPASPDAEHVISREYMRLRSHPGRSKRGMCHSRPLQGCEHLETNVEAEFACPGCGEGTRDTASRAKMGARADCFPAVTGLSKAMHASKPRRDVDHVHHLPRVPLLQEVVLPCYDGDAGAEVQELRALRVPGGSSRG